MATYKDLQECFDITGVDPLVIVDKDLTVENLKNLSPKVYQYMVWKYRKKENPELKLLDVQDFDFDFAEVQKAIRDFFQKAIQTNSS
jgi:hypothetical protein